MNNALLWLFVLLQLKHFIIDFPLQGPYQYLNKGTYGHPGGLLHAGLHGFGTLLVLCIILQFDIDVLRYASYIIILIVSAEIVIHYHIDWAKMTINKMTGWSPINSEKFWWLLGFDQLLHQLTYIGIWFALLNWKWFL